MTHEELAGAFPGAYERICALNTRATVVPAHRVLSDDAEAQLLRDARIAAEFASVFVDKLTRQEG